MHHSQMPSAANGTDGESTADDYNLWVWNPNKMPLSADDEYARELLACPRRSYLFYHYMGQTMLQRAQGWLSDPDWFREFDMQWMHSHSGVALCAARASKYPPHEWELWRWTRLHFPGSCG